MKLRFITISNNESDARCKHDWRISGSQQLSFSHQTIKWLSSFFPRAGKQLPFLHPPKALHT